MLFVSHEFFLNSRIIEPAMARHKDWAYPAGFVYYFVFIYATLAAFHLLKKK